MSFFFFGACTISSLILARYLNVSQGERSYYIIQIEFVFYPLPCSYFELYCLPILFLIAYLIATSTEKLVSNFSLFPLS